MTLRKPLTIAIGAIAAVTLLAGCSSGGGSTADFCKLGERYDSVDATDQAAMMSMMKDLAAAAPKDIKDDLNYLAEALDKISSVNQDDQDAAMEVLQSIDMVRVGKISEELPKKIEDVCGK